MITEATAVDPLVRSSRALDILWHYTNKSTEPRHLYMKQ